MDELEKYPFSGLVHVTGDSDTGKTSFAIECGAAPENIAFIDDDVKGRETVKQLQRGGYQFGIYHNLVEEAKGKKEIQVYNLCLRYIEEIERHEPPIEAVVWDTWTRFEATFKPFVTINPEMFRDYWSRSGEIKGAEQWLAAQDWEGVIINRILAKVKLLIVTTHLKPYRIGGKAVEGKSVPKCQTPVIEKSVLRLWLRQNPSGSSVPIGLVLKRVAGRRVTPQGVRTINILPRKIVPRPGDESLWDTIRWYWANPFGNREPTADETPNEFELSILDGHLTPDQRNALRLALIEAEQDQVVAEAVTPENLAKLDVISRIQTYLMDNPGASNEDVKAAISDASAPRIAQARTGIGA